MTKIEPLKHDFDTTSQVVNITDKLNEVISALNTVMDKKLYIPTGMEERDSIIFPSSQRLSIAATILAGMMADSGLRDTKAALVEASFEFADALIKEARHE